MNENILEVDSLVKYFPIKKQFSFKPSAWVKAVDNVSFSLKPGEVLGLVGESGCGKTTLVNTILNLYKPTSGKVIFDGKDIYNLNSKELRDMRKNMQIVFQDPYWSLDPRLLVIDIVGEPIRVHENISQDEFVNRVEDLLEKVGLSKDDAFRYPHEFSGGQRQRIAIARALSLNPKLIVLDEPTSSIHVISQSQILNLLKEFRIIHGFTYILISHDLSVVNFMADKIAVMYLGKIAEYGNSDEVFENPRHPYTQALFTAIPDIHKRGIDSLKVLEGNVPSAINPPSGCKFNTRCNKVMEVCRNIEPLLQDVGNEHKVACHLIK